MTIKIGLTFVGVKWILCFVALFATGAYSRLSTSSSRLDSAPVPLPWQRWAGRRLMILVAHPDDAEGCAGGLIPLLVSQATEVSFFIYTNGNKGCGNPICANFSASELSNLRQDEAFAGARSLGVLPENVRLLGYEDCELQTYPMGQLYKDAIREIRRFRPHVLMAWNPFPNFDIEPHTGWDDMGYHVDHQHSGRIALDAVLAADLDRLHPDLGEKWKIQEFYFFEFQHSTHVVDIGGTFDKKVAAFQCHQSQFTDHKAIRNMLLFFCSTTAHNAGMPGKLAEGFISYW